MRERELRPTSTRFAKNPMGFLASPGHPLMSERRLTTTRLAQEPLLVRERGSSSRATLTRPFKEAGLNLRIGSGLASNEALEPMCMAGFGPAYLSLHTCILEMRARLLVLLPMARNIIEREWFVLHSPSTQQLPQVAFAFERFLRLCGQMKINQLIESREALQGPPPAERPPAAQRRS